MPRMRTIDEAGKYFKEYDPDTALTKNAIRTLIITGKVPSCKIGCKYLVSIESLESYLLSGTELLR